MKDNPPSVPGKGQALFDLAFSASAASHPASLHGKFTSIADVVKTLRTT